MNNRAEITLLFFLYIMIYMQDAFCYYILIKKNFLLHFLLLTITLLTEFDDGSDLTLSKSLTHANRTLAYGS